MLTEQRYEEIIKLLEVYGTITVQELRDKLDASESTIRRDLNFLHDKGKLMKVFGGAVAIGAAVYTKDIQLENRKSIQIDEKILIARYAAELIRPDDFVYLDAGSTTGYMIDYITEQQATFVTNGVDHAQKLAALGFHVILLGGELKTSTDAVVGSSAILNIQQFHFTIGFWGTNGADLQAGFTTPDLDEAMVKRAALSQTKRKYMVCDHSKLGAISTVTFCGIEQATIITDQIDKADFTKLKNIIIPSK